MQAGRKSYHQEAEERLREHGISATPNRILVTGVLAGASAPMSLSELEDTLVTLDKSSIFRVLNMLLAHDVIHAVEDGRGVSKYELCHTESDHEDTDLHCHFYCHKCRRTFCFTDMNVPRVEVPSGYEVDGINYMIKGLCPDCSRQ